jgi:hypothetical protein
MKISSAWKRDGVKVKKNRGASKPKIRWDVLGLSDPNRSESTTSIETIRREVLSLASRGLGQDTISRSIVQDTKNRSRQARGSQAGRRRAT